MASFHYEKKLASNFWEPSKSDSCKFTVPATVDMWWHIVEGIKCPLPLLEEYIQLYMGGWTAPSLPSLTHVLAHTNSACLWQDSRQIAHTLVRRGWYPKILCKSMVLILQQIQCVHQIFPMCMLQPISCREIVLDIAETLLIGIKQE